MGTIKDCFNEILHGNKADSRLAARAIRKLVYSAPATGGNKHEVISMIIRTVPDTYANITEEWRQENFVMAVSVMYFLHDMEKQSDFLFPWLFQLLQHENGYIRHSAVKMISHEIGPLTYHLRLPGEKLREISPEHAEDILRSLFTNLNGLLAASEQPRHKKYKYIDDMPPSPYKSVQMVLADLEDSCQPWR